MKKIIAVLLAAVMTAALFTACGSEKKSEEAKPRSTTQPLEDKKTHTLYFKDSLKSGKATVTFLNSVSKESKSVKMKRIREEKSFDVYSCEGDTSVYNTAYITCGKDKTREFAFNKCVSGWHKTKETFLPYTYDDDETEYYHDFDDVTLKGFGYDKKVHIEKPEGYDPSSKEKYATVYLLDGHDMAPIKNENRTGLKGAPVAAEQVRAMCKVTDTKALVVAIENIMARDNELVPDIGESEDEKRFGHEKYESMDGSQLSDFIADTLVPYVRKHYNVYTDALHTSIAGASLGGLEAFYITMEHPDIFGTLGAFSPSFWEYDKATWNKYLSAKSFGDDSPFLYIYTGNERDDVGPFPYEMYNRLKNMGYPEEKLAYHQNEKGAHEAAWWCNMFSEFLSGMIFRSIEPLQKQAQ